MELARALRELGRRRRLLALGVLIAVAASILSVYRFEGGKLKSRSLQYAAATTQVLVDSEPSVLGNVTQSSEALSARAQVYANFMASPAILDIIARQVGLSGDQLYAAGPVNAQEPRVEQEPTALKRNVEITGETKPYRLNYEAQGNLPSVTIYSQAPTTSVAIGLANAAVVGLQRYVASVESGGTIPKRSRVVIRQLGPASGGVVDGGISKTLAIMVFVMVFLLWCVLMLVAARFGQTWRASAAVEQGAQDEDWSELADQHEARGKSHDEAPRGGNGHNPEGAPLHAHSGRDALYAPSAGAPSAGHEDDRAAAVPMRSIR